MFRRTKCTLLVWIALVTLGIVVEVSSMRRNGEDQNLLSSPLSQKEASPLLGPDGPFGESGSGKGGDAKVVLSIETQELLNTGDATTEVTEALTMVAVRNPDDYFEGTGVQNLELDLCGDEWVELFIKVLGCPIAGDEPFMPGDDTEQWRQRYKLKFQAKIKGYPMLGRIWNTYAYVSYGPEEIELLRKECEKVRSTTSNERARAGLSKLLSGCDQSSTLGLGLMLIPD